MWQSAGGLALQRQGQLDTPSSHLPHVCLPPRDAAQGRRIIQKRVCDENYALQQFYVFIKILEIGCNNNSCTCPKND
jgi:hypothetical protein